MKRIQEHTLGIGADDLDQHRQEQAIYKEYDTNQIIGGDSYETDHYADSNFDSTHFQGVHHLKSIELGSFRSEHYDNDNAYEDHYAVEESPKIRDADESFDKTRSVHVPSDRRERRFRYITNVAVWVMQISATAGSFLSVWTVSGCKFVSQRCRNEEGYEIECQQEYYSATMNGALSTAKANALSFKSFGFFTYDAFRGGSAGVVGGACAVYPSSTGINGIVPIGIMDANSFHAAQVCAVTAAMLSVCLALASYTVGVFVVRHGTHTYFSILVALSAALICILQGCTFLSISALHDNGSNNMTLYMDSTAYASAAAMICFFIALFCAVTKLTANCCSPHLQNEYIKHNVDGDSFQDDDGNGTNSPKIKRKSRSHREEVKDEEEIVSEDVSERGMLNDSSGSYLNSRTFSTPSEERWLESMPTYTMPGGTSVY